MEESYKVYDRVFGYHAYSLDQCTSHKKLDSKLIPCIYFGLASILQATGSSTSPPRRSSLTGMSCLMSYKRTLHSNSKILLNFKLKRQCQQHCLTSSFLASNHLPACQRSRTLLTQTGKIISQLLPPHHQLQWKFPMTQKKMPTRFLLFLGLRSN